MMTGCIKRVADVLTIGVGGHGDVVGEVVQGGGGQEEGESEERGGEKVRGGRDLSLGPSAPEKPCARGGEV